MGRQCIIEGCDNIISDRSHLDVCQTCRHGLYYWDKKSAAEVMERKTKLTKYRARLSTIVDDDVIDTRKRGVEVPSPKRPVFRLTMKKYLPRAHAQSITGQPPPRGARH